MNDSNFFFTQNAYNIDILREVLTAAGMDGLHCTLPPFIYYCIITSERSLASTAGNTTFHENFLAVAPEASKARSACLPHPASPPGLPTRPSHPAHLTRPTLRQAGGHVHSRVSAPPRSRQKLYINRSKISRDKIAFFCPRVSVGA